MNIQDKNMPKGMREKIGEKQSALTAECQCGAIYRTRHPGEITTFRKQLIEREMSNLGWTIVNGKAFCKECSNKGKRRTALSTTREKPLYMEATKLKFGATDPIDKSPNLFRVAIDPRYCEDENGDVLAARVVFDNLQTTIILDKSYKEGKGGRYDESVGVRSYTKTRDGWYIYQFAKKRLEPYEVIRGQRMQTARPVKAVVRHYEDRNVITYFGIPTVLDAPSRADFAGSTQSTVTPGRAGPFVNSPPIPNTPLPLANSVGDGDILLANANKDDLLAHGRRTVASFNEWKAEMERRGDTIEVGIRDGVLFVKLIVEIDI